MDQEGAEAPAVDLEEDPEVASEEALAEALEADPEEASEDLIITDLADLIFTVAGIIITDLAVTTAEADALAVCSVCLSLRSF